jgi:hypothetical protein
MSFRIRICLDLEDFYPDPAKSFGSHRIRVHNTAMVATFWRDNRVVLISYPIRIYYFALNAEMEILLGSLPGLLGGSARPRPASALPRR